MGFIRFLLIIALVYLVIMLFIRYIFPWLLKRFFRKMESQINQEYGFGQESKRSTTDTTGNSKKKKKISNDEGEYINYEEIKD